MTRSIVIKHPVGRFIFASDVILSHAKLIRDSVIAQILVPNYSERRIKNDRDAKLFIEEHLDGPANQVKFSFVRA